MKQHTTRRPGFTLVEMLVAAALTMLIMAILAQSFQVAMDSMSHLRAAAELQDRLRSATEVMRTDLMSPHIDDEGVANGRVSAIRFDLNPSILPRAGFFRIDQTAGAAAEFTSTVVGTPKDYSSVARGTENHRLLFTARLSGKTRQSLFTAPRIQPVNGTFQGLDGRNDNLIQDAVTTYGSRWAIVSWFLAPSGEISKGPNPQPLYNLHRRVKLLAEVQDCYIDPNNANAYHYSFNPVTGRVNTPQDIALFSTLTRPLNLVAPLNTYIHDMSLPTPDGSDIVLSNVASFEIKADYSQQFVTISGPVTTLYPRPAADPAALTALGITNVPLNGFNQDFPFDDLPKNPLAIVSTPLTPNLRSFDTGLAGGTGLLNLPTSAPQQYRMKALQVKIRIYDPKTMATRQVTLIQEL